VQEPGGAGMQILKFKPSLDIIAFDKIDGAAAVAPCFNRFL
jgi:hypothetical protein